MWPGGAGYHTGLREIEMAAVLTVVKAATGGIGGLVIQDTTIVDVNFTATGDKSATIAHGLAGTPQEVYLTPLLLAFYASQLFAGTINSTNVILTKTSVAASTGLQVRTIIKRPHSYGR